MINLKNKTIKGMLLICIITLFSVHYSCDLIDPTEVKNPDITQDNLMANANGGAVPLVIGLQRQFAQALGYIQEYAEPTSDNYVNTAVNISQLLDKPREIKNDDLSLNGTGILSTSPYFHLQNLRALADFGLEVILPRDMTATNEDKAITHFYRGMALLLLSELHSVFPIKDDNVPVTAAAATGIAISEFKLAFGLSSDADLKASCKLALARAYRLNGDKVNADAEAKALLAMSPSHNFQAEYDPVTLNNNLYYWVVARNQNDLQPLPRLDFLDPKYNLGSCSVSVLKAEEAHLILAEVAIANNDLLGAKTNLKNAITLAKSRATSTYMDKDPRRNRPNDATYKVKADASAPAIANLIQKRGGSAGTQVTLYGISGTSLTTAGIDALTTQAEIVRALYLLRQEIFFGEGRRITDLGIRWPVIKWQTDACPSYPADAGTSVVVPSYIPQSTQMDDFTTDAVTGTVTCLFDMNKVLADNYATIKPFK